MSVGTKRCNHIPFSNSPVRLCLPSWRSVCWCEVSISWLDMWNILVCMSPVWCEGLQVSIYISTHTESCWMEVPNAWAKCTRAWLTLCLNFLRYRKNKPFGCRSKGWIVKTDVRHREGSGREGGAQAEEWGSMRKQGKFLGPPVVILKAVLRQFHKYLIS